MLNSCVMHRHTGPAPFIKVWGGFAYHSRTPLVRIAGILSCQRYISIVVEPVVLPYLGYSHILTGNEVHFWLNGPVNKQNCCIWSEANPQVYVETPLHPEKLTVWCALRAAGILLPKR
ncbi:transposable element Tcb1 transposase [Trichonephila clavipes]|uniref:Transposable element Tcb1 transposase n=1 Tax=Trichonephila clavipes TaxID=2585209 RepID=A0A8X6W2P6_TRICX|nr:transposable element Tcb1 transposase [Trichonephila clavipes]